MAQRRKRTRNILHAANATAEWLPTFPDYKHLKVTLPRCQSVAQLRLQTLHARMLSEEQQTEIVSIFETNMKELYEKNSDEGYLPVKKRKELFDADARYLLVYPSSENLADAQRKSGLYGFVHFRFVEEDNAPVLYIYEIQLKQVIQRAGVGQHLMQFMMQIGKSEKMDKLMLTVFKSNSAAIRFYIKKLGFQIDEISPSACGDPSQSYEILSRYLW